MRISTRKAIVVYGIPNVGRIFTFRTPASVWQKRSKGMTWRLRMCTLCNSCAPTRWAVSVSSEVIMVRPMSSRLLLSATASSVNSLPKKNGKGLTMREYFGLLLRLIWPCPSRMDLFFWYGSAFGSPVARVQGIGWIQELVARLTHKPIAVHNTSTNSTLDDISVTFPLDHSLYVDATHEVVILNSKQTTQVLCDWGWNVPFPVITALNLISFAEQGPLPHTHIPKNRKFHVSELSPFAANLQFQRKLLHLRRPLINSAELP